MSADLEGTGSKQNYIIGNQLRLRVIADTQIIAELLTGMGKTKGVIVIKYTDTAYDHFVLTVDSGALTLKKDGKVRTVHLCISVWFCACVYASVSPSPSVMCSIKSFRFP